MPAFIDKIAGALHLKKHHVEEGVTTAKAPEDDAGSSAPTASAAHSTPNADNALDVPATSASTTKTPVFDDSKVSVIFVLGGPGAGKGTQCANLVADFGFRHLSAGDLLRAEQNREGSEHGEMIRTYIREGQVVPMEVTIKLLENAMRAVLEEKREGSGWEGGKGRFLIDGFPRKMDQAVKFDEDVCLSSLVLYFDTTEEEMTKRLLERGKTSGREDDNEESIKKRFKTYKEQTMPVIEYYSKQNKVSTIDSTTTIEGVHEKAKATIEQLFAGQFTQNVTV
ncbi:UMP-CMP kinase [Sparassis latifolia]|uniref:Uridylate kinase n=1 Tax=Sparassis crispa TaxID=139825 RepID=A0A401GK74_9APHY|nr:UMP-CMP kinase [Sparassis crispa]GBE82571.1 UMP-CMP kinase [Sparassis crispa]